MNRRIAAVALLSVTAAGSACTPAQPQPPPTVPPSVPPTAPPSVSGDIRRTDWRNATVLDLRFCGESDDAVEFENGSNGLEVACVILPGDARPAYGEFLVEEPANRPSTEDALVLVEVGKTGAARRQALVPVQLGEDGRTLFAWPPILGDEPGPAGDRAMTFTSYRIEPDATVSVTVRHPDGSAGTRRYVQADGSGNWERM